MLGGAYASGEERMLILLEGCSRAAADPSSVGQPRRGTGVEPHSSAHPLALSSTGTARLSLIQRGCYGQPGAAGCVLIGDPREPRAPAGGGEVRASSGLNAPGQRSSPSVETGLLESRSLQPAAAHGKGCR